VFSFVLQFLTMAEGAVNFVGLTDAEAARRLELHGANIIDSARPRSSLAMALGTIREPMFLLLLACALLYVILGDPGEAAILSAAMAVVIGITIIQEQRTERTLEALRDLSSPRALVIRDGVRKRIAGKDVVPGDLVVLNEGDRVPADGFVVKSGSLKIDESLLTGESVAVAKIVWNGRDPLGQAGGDETPFAYSGSLVVQGDGHVLVQATGAATAIGRIGSSIKETSSPPSSLQVDMRRVVKLVAGSSLMASLAVALIFWLRDGQPLRGILMGLTFAMSTIPEEFPVILSVFMALGAWRLSKSRVLTRQMTAIETLGSATALCVDKTGTLTENKMSLVSLWVRGSGLVELVKGDHAGLQEDHRAVLSALASASDPHGFDPMDAAAIAARSRLLPAIDDSAWELVRSYPLQRPLLAVGYAWRPFAYAGKPLADGKYLLACKGAPESVLGLCQMSPAEHDGVMEHVRELAARGERVLAVANLRDGGVMPASLGEGVFDFIGLAGFKDPVKQGVPEAVHQCDHAGIKVLMITGDYPVTALAVAEEAGIDTGGGVLTGNQVASLTDAELSARLKSVRVLARMVPEQKLRVVRSLQESCEVVAMTGDGVNDAPALKAAHIGIAMGGRGTDVAREAADLVLVDDNFTSIVAAIKQGRRIYDNIQKAVSYIIAIHVPVVGLAMLPVILGVPTLLWPVHLAFLELVIDPVCSIVFEAEPEEATIMARPPRPIGVRLFNKAVVGTGAIQGLMALTAVLLVYFTIGRAGGEPDHARAVAFASLLFLNVALISSLRSRSGRIWDTFLRPNPALYWVLGVVAVVAAIVFFVPPAARAFHFSAPHINDLVVTAGISALVLVAFEGVKAAFSRV
jgi:Ca2+-transporting ATPase